MAEAFKVNTKMDPEKMQIINFINIKNHKFSNSQEKRRERKSLNRNIRRFLERGLVIRELAVSWLMEVSKKKK